MNRATLRSQPTLDALLSRAAGRLPRSALPGAMAHGPLARSHDKEQRALEIPRHRSPERPLGADDAAYQAAHGAKQTLGLMAS